MSRDIAPFGLRLPVGLRKSLEKEAKTSHRSMNAELVLRLEKSLDQYPMDRAPQVVRVKGTADAHELPSPGYNSLEMERRLIEAFRSLPDEKKMALLALLEN